MNLNQTYLFAKWLIATMVLYFSCLSAMISGLGIFFFMVMLPFTYGPPEPEMPTTETVQMIVLRLLLSFFLSGMSIMAAHLGRSKVMEQIYRQEPKLFSEINNLSL